MNLLVSQYALFIIKNKIRPIAHKGYGSIAHKAKQNGLLAKSRPTAQRPATAWRPKGPVACAWGTAQQPVGPGDWRPVARWQRVHSDPTKLVYYGTDVENAGFRQRKVAEKYKMAVVHWCG